MYMCMHTRVVEIMFGYAPPPLSMQKNGLICKGMFSVSSTIGFDEGLLHFLPSGKHISIIDALNRKVIYLNK